MSDHVLRLSNEANLEVARGSVGVAVNYYNSKKVVYGSNQVNTCIGNSYFLRYSKKEPIGLQH
jgi:hypothetical protein